MDGRNNHDNARYNALTSGWQPEHNNKDDNPDDDVHIHHFNVGVTNAGKPDSKVVPADGAMIGTVYIEENNDETCTTATVESANGPSTEIDEMEYFCPTLPANSWNVPENFSMVVDGVYRSSFPRMDHFAYLKSLGLRSVLVLIPEPYPEENAQFLKENDIRFFQVGMSGNKEPFVHVPHSVITEALEIAINPANHPILIHCNRGKHRTGCLVGCLRRLQDWSLTMIFDEYRRFSFPKSRPLDQQLIELYDDTDIYTRATTNEWLPIKW